MTTSARTTFVVPTRGLLNKVPEITLWFWVIKILCTTVGETAADFLNVNLNFGLTATSAVTGILLVVALWAQLRAPRYIPGLYWVTVALVSVFGTLVTDNLTDNLGFPLEASTIIFAVLLAAVFAIWYRSEGTLSIHSILTQRREIFYWVTILVTFALGTATGDLMAEGLGLGYTVTGLIVAGLIALTAIGWKLRLNSILSFWIIYILTRPLGASIGDYLSQPAAHGGLGLGATLTSVIFLAGILGIVAYLSATKVDAIPPTEAAREAEADERGGHWQTVVVIGALLIAGGIGYTVRKAALDDTIALQATVGAGGGSAPGSPLGDTTTFRTITQDTLGLLDAGDQAAATTRIDDLEYEWDQAQSVLKPLDVTAWNVVDGKIDTVLRELRATSPQAGSEKTALTALLGAL
ncbi:MAG: hypothetical protein ABJA16_00820 [Nakamurella sp.]